MASRSSSLSSNSSSGCFPSKHLHARHIIFRSFPASPGSDRYFVSSPLIGRQSMRPRWLFRKCLKTIADATATEISWPEAKTTEKASAEFRYSSVETLCGMVET